jgi:hypothetical protein
MIEFSFTLIIDLLKFLGVKLGLINLGLVG